MDISLLKLAATEAHLYDPITTQHDPIEAYYRLKNFIIRCGEDYTIIDEGVVDNYKGGLLINSSWCAGTEIFIGQYDDDWHKVVSLAHEIGHLQHYNELVQAFLKAPKERDSIEHSTLILETMCWQYGASLLETLNIQIPHHATLWAGEQLASYAGYKG